MESCIPATLSPGPPSNTVSVLFPVWSLMPRGRGLAPAGAVFTRINVAAKIPSILLIMFYQSALPDREPLRGFTALLKQVEIQCRPGTYCRSKLLNLLGMLRKEVGGCDAPFVVDAYSTNVLGA